MRRKAAPTGQPAETRSVWPCAGWSSVQIIRVQRTCRPNAIAQNPAGAGSDGMPRLALLLHHAGGPAHRFDVDRRNRTLGQSEKTLNLLALPPVTAFQAA